MELGWPDDYPSAASLRREVEAMAESVTEAVLDSVPSSELIGLYVKGSARRRWDSVIDYVPEISDVDIHILFRDETCIERRLGTMEAALGLQSGIEDRYRDKVRSPIHMPRPQLVILNHLLQDPDYSPSPRESLTTLWGEDCAEAAYDEERERGLARRRLLSDAEILQVLPFRVVDKPGRYLLTVLRDLTWRVSPAGPRVLCVRRMPSAEAWSLNRTGVVGALERLGEEGLAAAYRDFYVSAWSCFLSNYKDSSAARNAIAAGSEVLRQASEAAQVGGSAA